MSSEGQRLSTKKQDQMNKVGIEGLGVGGSAISTQKNINLTSHYITAP